jgi:hypothetical protein
MKADRKSFSPVILIHLVGILFFAAGLCINPLRITRAFFSDESVYYTMAYSFAYDGDMEFQLEDLVRVYKEFAAGPQGIVLKLNERDGTIVFGKSFLYALAAAPFVFFFRTNGFVVLHAILLWLNLLCAYRFCSSFMQPRKAALFSFFYFLANASLVYLFWMTPEYFNMSLVCFGCFFFVSSETLNSKWKIFQAPYSYAISALFFAMATYSKPTNALLIVPLGIWLFVRKKILIAMICLAAFILCTVGLLGANVFFTGDWNYQGGKRAVFYNHFPYERPGASPYAPFKSKKEFNINLETYRPPFYRKAFSYNWLYFFFGRYSGLAIYFFPMFFVLIYYLFSKKTSLSTAVYAAGWLGILTYMVGIPWNYFGGSGTIGNRYLLNAFPVLLFAMAQEPSRKWLAGGLASSLLYGTVFLATPVFSSFNNAFHQQKYLFRGLPVEMTLLADLPFNTNRRAVRVAFDQPASYFLYFTDENAYFRETFDHEIGFWVQGERTTEIILRTFEPVSKMRLRIKSIDSNNALIVQTGSETIEIPLRERSFYEGEVKLPSPFPYDRDNKGATYLYDIRLHSKSGVISSQGGTGERYLGTFVRIELPEAVAEEIPEEEPTD